jgi:hypothetical protein
MAILIELIAQHTDDDHERADDEIEDVGADHGLKSPAEDILAGRIDGSDPPPLAPRATAGLSPP